MPDYRQLLLYSSPEQVVVYFKVIFNRHVDKSHNLAGVPIDCANMGDPKHHELLILIYVDFV